MKTVIKMRLFFGTFAATWLVFALTQIATFAQSVEDLPAKDKFHLFLLIGQSNMAGRGVVSQADRQPHSRILMFTKDNAWEPATDPMHFDKPKIVGVGLGRTFGMRIAEANPGVTVGLIPCAVGGSPISSWEPGGYHEQTKSHPYDEAFRRARIALKSGRLAGILWHQGESDSSPGKAEVYEEKLHAMIARFRKKLGAPNVPFVAGQMGQFPERPWNQSKIIVDNAHRNLPGKIPNTTFVRSDGLKHKGDEVHFDSASYREFGERYVEAYQEIVDGKKDSVEGQ